MKDALRIVYNEKSSSFQDLLIKVTVTMHHRNIRTLATGTTRTSFTYIELSFFRTRLQLQFTKKQFSKKTKGKLSKIWY